MEAELQFLIAVGFMAVLFILGTVHLGIIYSIIRHLKKYHFRKWERIGSPSSIFGMGIESGSRLLSFISSGDYLYLRDERLNKKIASTKIVEKLAAFVLAVGIALWFWAVFASV